MHLFYMPGVASTLTFGGSVTTIAGGAVTAVAQPTDYNTAAGFVMALTGLAGMVLGAWASHEKSQNDKLKVSADLANSNANLAKANADLARANTEQLKAEAALALVKQTENSDKIHLLEMDNARIAREGEIRHQAIKNETERQNRENTAKYAELQSKAEAAETKAAQLQEELKRQVRHEVNKAANVLALEAETKRRNTPDPDAPTKVMLVGNDPDHPVFTVPVPLDGEKPHA